MLHKLAFDAMKTLLVEGSFYIHHNLPSIFTLMHHIDILALSSYKANSVPIVHYSRKLTPTLILYSVIKNNFLLLKLYMNSSAQCFLLMTCTFTPIIVILPIILIFNVFKVDVFTLDNCTLPSIMCLAPIILWPISCPIYFPMRFLFGTGYYAFAFYCWLWNNYSWLFHSFKMMNLCWSVAYIIHI